MQEVGLDSGKNDYAENEFQEEVSRKDVEEVEHMLDDLEKIDNYETRIWEFIRHSVTEAMKGESVWIKLLMLLLILLQNIKK